MLCVVGVGGFGFSVSQGVGALAAIVDVSIVDPTHHHFFVLCGDYCVDIDGAIFCSIPLY